MPRVKQAVPSISKHIHLPQELAIRVELELYSDLEGKVPHGAWQEFLVKVIKEHFELGERRKAFAEEIGKMFEEGQHVDTVDQRLYAELRALGFGRAIDIIEEYWS